MLTSHVHRHKGGSGHAWQERFKAFPIEEKRAFIGGSPLFGAKRIAGELGARAEEWPYSSLAAPTAEMPMFSSGPVPRGRDWLEHVNLP